MNHRRTCEDCYGSGKVRNAPASPELDALDREWWESESISRQERMMGA